MYNDILDAVVGRLRELFGDEYGICTEPAEQGTNGPCFFVQLQESTEKPMIGPRYFRKTEILIRYQPEETPGIVREMNRAAEVLMNGMESVALADDSRLRGTGRSALPDLERMQLIFRVSYNLFVIKTRQEETTMETIEIEKGMVK